MSNFPNFKSLLHLLSYRAEQEADEPAYIFLQDGDGQPESLTWRELEARAKFIAAHLQSHQDPQSQPILLMLQPGLDYIAAFFGCLYAGAIPVPAYPPSSARQLSRLQAVANDACAYAAITTSVEMQRIDKLRSRAPQLSISDWYVLDALEQPADQWRAASEATVDTLAFLQYTSGSTSTPKGVMVSHGNLLKNLQLIGCAINIQKSDVTVSWLPPWHDFGLIGGILNPLYWGHRCVLMRPASFLLSPYRWLKAISDYRGTITSAPNFAYDLCARAITPAQMATLDLGSWRIASNGAEPIRVETLRNFSQRFAVCGVRPQTMVPGYGLAESTLLVSAVQGTLPDQLAAHLKVSKAGLQRQCVEPCVDGSGTDEFDAVSLVSVGKILAHYKVVMVDPNTLQRCAGNRVGELWVQGPCVAQGYWKRPEATQATFHAHIAGEDDGPYLRTGDLGFFYDDQLYICGRLKDLIIINGRNIYPQDVEHASFTSHATLRIDGAIAFGMEGEEVERLVVVQEMDFRIAADEVLFGVIAKAVAEQVDVPPDTIVLVKAGQIPRTSSGKVQRQLCKKMFQDGELAMLARWDRPIRVQQKGAPCAEIEAAMHSVVASSAMMVTLLREKLAARLGLSPSEIDPRQPFACYGLDSLAAVQLADELSGALHYTLAPTVFWEYPSTLQLAQFLADEVGASQPQGDQAAAGDDAAEAIAIIGMSCRFPGADDIESFWRLLQQGGVMTGPVAPERVAAQTFIRPKNAAPHVSMAGFLGQVDLFDAQFFGISPLEAARIDPQQRLVLEVAWEALENAGIPSARIAGTQTGVFVGISTHDYENLQGFAADGLTLYAAAGSAASIAANRLSYLFDLRGPSIAIDTACSSSLVAVHLACQSLRNGESTLALAGGVNLILSPDLGVAFAGAGMLAPDGLCKSFDAAADGYVRGEGCGIVALKRLSDALRDGDSVRAIIRGSAVGQDGRSNGLVAPNGAAQVNVVRRALNDAGVSSTSIAYVEAHGTGTALGDPIELRALKEVLLPGRADGQRCYIGSVKTNIGHLEAAAGVASLIKATLALEHGIIPANQHYRTPNPHCSLVGLPLEIPTRQQAWCQTPQHAGVSSFGFGGTLAHVVLEQAPQMSPSGPGWPWQLLSFSAKTETALEASAGLLLASMEKSPGLPLADISWTHHIGRDAFGWRSMLVCSSTEDARQVLGTRAPDRIRSAQVPAQAPPVFFMFPGQGSQTPGMARELYQHLPAFRFTVDHCTAIVRRQSGIDMHELLGLADGAAGLSAGQLQQTQYAQLALFVIEYALAQLWMGCGIQPAAMIGHSLGEYVAACLAGVFSLDNALALVAARGRLMQQLPAGAMLSVSLDEAQVNRYLDDSIALAAVNGRERCVVAGELDAVEALERSLTGQGVAYRRLSTSHAFHSHMMEPALEPFSDLLAGFILHAPKFPFMSNVTGTWITEEEATSAAYWVRHMREPVRFAQGLAALAERTGAAEAIFIEVGPGRTLTTLALQSANTISCSWSMLLSLGAAPAHGSDLAHYLATLGHLWLSGQDIDWITVYSGQKRRRLHLPTYPFERQRHWIETQPAVISAGLRDMSAATVTPMMAVDASVPDQSVLMPDVARVERDICAIVAELLRIDPGKISLRAPLLELGADSLILVQAISRIKKHFGITVTIRQLFEELTTISALAAFISEQLASMVSTAAANTTNTTNTTNATNAATTNQPVMQAVSASIDAATGARSVIADLPSSSGDHAASSPLERIIARQIEELAQMTQQTTQVMLQQLEALKADGSGSAQRHAPASPPALPPGMPILAPGSGSAQTVFVTPDKALAMPKQFDPYAQLTPFQTTWLGQFMQRFIARTRGSMEQTAQYKPVHADYRAQAGFRFSASDPVLPLTLRELFYPIVSERAAGSRIWDVDGNEYVDLTMGFGVHLFGHSPEFIQQALQHQMQLGMQIGPQSPLAGEVAQLVHELTGMERVAFCNSGTEAVILALRLARTATGRKKFVMFNGSYHGWSDGSLVGVDLEQGGNGIAAPLMPGLTPGIEQHALVLEYGESESLDIIRQHGHELAAVLVEPVQGRHPELQPREFLHQLRALTRELGITLIFDEMITGFRLHPGGAQAIFEVRADIATYGKAAGGGMPLGMVAGAARYLDAVDGGRRNSADGRASVTTTFFAGTFSKHPLTMAAARAVLRMMKQEGPALQQRLTQRTTGLVERINALFVREQLSMRLVQCGSLFRLNTTGNLDLFCYHLVMHGLYVWEGRNMFLSTAHSDADIDFIYSAFEASVQDLRDGGFLPSLQPSLPPANHVPLQFGTAAVHGAKGLALTSTQQGIWLECWLNGDAALAYQTHFDLRLNGSVNHALLQAALQQVVNRHDALRTVIDPSGELQQVLPTLSVDLPVVSFAQSGDPATELNRWLIEDSHRPFDLEHGPLLRAALLHEGAQRHLLSLTVHHVVSDGISDALLVGEIGEVYSALCKNASPELPPAEPLSSYVAQHQAYLGSEQFKQDEAWWMAQFADMPPPLALPTDRPLHLQSSLHAQRKQVTICGRQYQQLLQFGRQHGCTLFMTLMAATSVLLQRLTQQEDLVVGMPVAVGRPDDAQSHLVSCTINVVPVRCRPRADVIFSRYLADIKSSLVEAYLHANYPFMLLTRKLAQQHNSHHRLLAPVMFNLDRPLDMPEFAGLDVALAESPMSFGQDDLMIDITQLPEQLIVKFQYNTDLFDGETITRMAGYFKRLLEEIVANPERPVGELPMLEEGERHRLLEEWNDTSKSYGGPATIHTLFEAQVERSARQVALVYEGNELTWDELNTKANRLAHRLRELGVGPDVLVGICVERSVDMMVGLLGVLKAGGAYLPLDPAYPAQRLAYMLDDARPAVLLTQSHLLPELPSEGLETLCLDAEPAWASDADSNLEHNPKHNTRPGNLAYVIYTSGSTGRPKGVAVSHASVVNFLRTMAEAPGMTAQDVLLSVTSLSFDIAVLELFLPIVCGARTVLATREQAADPQRLAAMMNKHAVTVMQATPSTWRMLVDSGWPQQLSSLKVLCGGEALSHKLVAELFKHVPVIWNLYGPTETTIWSAAHCITPQASRPLIGRPIANTQLYILDANFEPVPAGVAGELYIAGDGLARGYLHRPGLTAERFVPDPFVAGGARMYRSGDLARFTASGNIEYLGRIDNQIKLHGFRIELGAIEAALSDQPGVHEAIVLVREEMAGDKRLVAYVVQEGAATPVEELASAWRAALALTLPDYMVPSHYVVLAQFPMTLNGKVDRNALPAPDNLRSDLGYVAPRDATEETLANICADVLKLDRIGIHDNFFALGGHSLLVTKVTATIRQEFGVNLPVRALFETATVAELAVRISNLMKLLHEPVATDAGTDLEEIEF